MVCRRGRGHARRRRGRGVEATAIETRPEGASAADASHRRCIVTGALRPRHELLRFVVAPDGKVVPDLSGRLPGRGLWLTARRDIVAAAVSKRLFARAARQPVVVEDDLADRVEVLLTKRCLDHLGLARRAGQAVMGFAKVQAALAAGKVAVLVAAADGAADGRGKLKALAPGLPLAERLTSAELGAAFGREHVVHAALSAGGLADRFLADMARLGGFRPEPVEPLNEASDSGGPRIPIESGGTEEDER